MRCAALPAQRAVYETFTFTISATAITKQYQVVVSYATKIERALDVRYRIRPQVRGRGISFLRLTGKSVQPLWFRPAQRSK